MQDYTINDAFNDGFECGLLYALRYSEETTKSYLTDADIIKLSEHLTMKRSDRSSEEWAIMIHRNIARWRG